MYTLRIILYRLIHFYELVILVSCILSWVPVYDGIVHDVREALRSLTEPFLDVFRRLVPAIGGGGMGIDFSPMLAIIALDLLKRIVLTL